MLSNKAIRFVSSTLVAILGFVVLLPILALVFGSFWSASPVSLEGHFTLQNWIKASLLRIPATLPALFLNSLLFASLVAIISMVLGVAMAYLVARTDIPYGHIFEKLSIAPRAFPILIAALAWVMLLSPRIGVLNLIAREYLGFPLFNIYSFPGMVFLMVLYESPIVFLIALNAFRLMDPALEEQSIACGNTVLGTLRKITLPTLRGEIGSWSDHGNFLISRRKVA